MRTDITVGLLLMTLILTPIHRAQAVPQAKHTPPAKPVADPLAKAILGTWAMDIPPPKGGPLVHIQFTFRPDGSETQVLEAPGKKIIQKIKYRVVNGWLSQSLVSAEENGKPFKPSQPHAPQMKITVEGDTLSFALSAQGAGKFSLHRVKN